jgi:drug/metabolite transporter (DMT)-like permease
VRRLALLAVIWGWSFLFIKVAVEGMTPSAVAGARIVLGAAVMVVILRARGASLPRDLVMWRHFGVLGLVYNAVPFTLLAWSEEYVTSALTAVLNASTAMFAAIMTAAFLGERLRRPQVIGLLLGFAGVAIAAGVGVTDLSGSSLIGVGAAIAASASYGIAYAYARKYVTHVPPLVAAGGQLLAASVLILPLAVVTTVRHGIHLAPHRILAVTILGIFGTGFAYLLNYRLIADVGSTRASVVTQLVPVVAVTVGVLFLGEPFHLRLLAGGALTLFGVALLNERIRRFRAVPAPH